MDIFLAVSSIFFLRLLDQTLGTLRMLYVNKEYENLLYYRSTFTSTIIQRILNLVQSILLRNYYSTEYLWKEIRSDEFLKREFLIPELNIHGNIFHAKSTLLKVIYPQQTSFPPVRVIQLPFKKYLLM